MCGLVGGTLFDEKTMTTAIRRLDHRGRDASVIRQFRRVGPRGADLWLGHNRLAVQDPGRGADQPYAFGDGCSLVFNGELWRSTLEGYKHLTDGRPARSDTALLALMYERYGSDPAAFSQRLDGMFAFAIYDAPRERLVIARDRLGRIPLHWWVGPSGIAFASERKACNANLFPPGACVTYSLRDGSVRWEWFHDWARFKIPAEELDAGDRGADYYAEGIRSKLTAAVSNELVADVPICTILSGGIDSTVITEILAKLVPDLVAYTVSVGPGDGKDDLAYARRAAKVIGIPLREVIITPEDCERGLREAVWAVEDRRWVQVAPAVPQIALARRIGADGYRVVFGGEGSDELFGSYNDVRRWAWRPQQYHDRRVELCEKLHDNNVIRGNKACMWGGTVELRTPFLDSELVDFCLRIPTRYRADDDGRGRVMKPLLREAFRDRVPGALLMRRKVTFQEGAHSSFLKARRDDMKTAYESMFSTRR